MKFSLQCNGIIVPDGKKEEEYLSDIGLMRSDERNANWFAVEAKSFEITVDGEGKKQNTLSLNGVEVTYRGFDSAKRGFSTC